MFCTISNEICSEPVVSTLTGHVFEKTLLEKHLKTTGRCPITEAEMSMDNVVEIKGYQLPAQPRPPTVSSVPNLLKTLQNEWDQLMLESYNLKKQNQDLRQQLSHSLYQHDAACRVIARLTQERDRALDQLANTKQTMTYAVHEADVRRQEELAQLQQEQESLMQQREKRKEKEKVSESESKETQDIDIDGSENNNNNNNVNKNNKNGNGKDGFASMPGCGKTNKEIVEYYPSLLWNAKELTKEISQAISSNATNLSAARRKSKKSKNEGLTNSDELSQFSLKESFTLHSEQDAGICCMDLHKNVSMNKYIVSGGFDCRIIVFNRETSNFDYILSGHTKKVTNVEFHSKLPLIFSSSADNTVRIWRYDETVDKWSTMTHLHEFHKDSISGMQTHCLDCYFATCSYDGTWGLHSLQGNTLLKGVDPASDKSKEKRFGFSSLATHPDGNLIGTACVNDSIVRIWDLRDGSPCAAFDGNKGLINKITFNENGYYLGSCDDNGICKIYDLRKIGKVNSSYTINEVENSRIKTIEFDESGTYLAIGQSNGIDLYQVKKWNKIATLQGHDKDVTSIKFGPNASFIASASRDSKLNIYSL